MTKNESVALLSRVVVNREILCVRGAKYFTNGRK